MTDLLRRAWDALDSFKQAYPENWSEEDEQVLKDLMRADLKLSGVNLKWVGLTDEEIIELANGQGWNVQVADFPASLLRTRVIDLSRAIEAKLKQKNSFAEEKNT